MRISKLALGSAAALCLAPPAGQASAQQATISPSATQVSKGVWSVRELSSLSRYEQDTPAGGRTIEQWTHETVLMYGIEGDLMGMLHIPVIDRRTDGPGARNNDDTGVGDVTLMGQYRFLQQDTGPINTLRGALQFGVELPSYDDAFSSDSFDPLVGVAFTRIDGRHGTGAAVRWKFNTGGQDDPIAGGDSSDNALEYHTSYLYRLSPQAYTADTRASFYFQTELNGLYETNGDHELMVAPGLLYEATKWAAELSVRLPVLEEVDHRPETRWSVLMGVRLLF